MAFCTVLLQLQEFGEKSKIKQGKEQDFRGCAGLEEVAQAPRDPVPGMGERSSCWAQTPTLPGASPPWNRQEGAELCPLPGTDPQPWVLQFSSDPSREVGGRMVEAGSRQSVGLGRADTKLPLPPCTQGWLAEVRTQGQGCRRLGAASTSAPFKPQEPTKTPPTAGFARNLARQGAGWNTAQRVPRRHEAPASPGSGSLPAPSGTALFPKRSQRSQG